MSDEIPRPGFAMPATWFGIGLITTLLAGTLVAWRAYGSESAGVTATYVAAFPVGFAWAAGLAGLVTHFVSKSGLPRMLVPPGCGLIGGVAMLGLILVFFTAIFPAL